MPGNERTRGRPNILLLVAEDMGARVRAFGDPVAVTPNLDALARAGVRFDNVFTTAGVCAPSRAALITGVHANAMGAGHMRSYELEGAEYVAVPPPEVKAFPELLRRAGYFTYVNAKLDYQFSRVLPGQGPFTVWDAESFGKGGVSWRDCPGDTPFFGMLNYMETHEGGLFPRVAWPRSFAHVLMAGLHTWLHRGVGDVVSAGDVTLPPYYPDLPEVRSDIARHYNNIRTMDRRVGEILAALDEDGLADDTIVIWTADHGDGLPRAKRELFDSGLRVPMIVRWPEKYRPPGVEPGDIDHRLTSFVDLAPQILEWAGVTPPEFIQGRPFLTGAPRRYVYAARDRIDRYGDRQRAVRDDRYKYIRNYHPDEPGAMRIAFRQHLASARALRSAYEAGELDAAQRRWFEPRGAEELYDLATDPHEVVNLTNHPAYKQTLERMRGALASWQERVADLGAIPEAELAERFWPGGSEPVTASPNFEQQGGAIHIRCSTPGASIGYRVGGGAWKLYVSPLPRPEHGTTLEAKAVRYGWAESEVVGFTP